MPVMSHKYRRREAAQEIEQEKLRSFKREAILRGHTDMVPLVAPQPDPRNNLILLPVTIKIGMSWHNLIRVWGLFGIPLLFLIVVFYQWTALMRIQSLFVMAELVAVLALVSTIGVFATREKIAVDDIGLTVIKMGGKATMRWDEARIFALRSGNTFRDTSTYELALTENYAISWTRLRNTFFVSPSTSCQEYDKQMDALLACIAEKTHLPLYDLR